MPSQMNGCHVPGQTGAIQNPAYRPTGEFSSKCRRGSSLDDVGNVAGEICRDGRGVLPNAEPAGPITDDPASEHGVSELALEQGGVGLKNIPLFAIATWSRQDFSPVSVEADIFAFARQKRFHHIIP